MKQRRRRTNNAIKHKVNVGLDTEGLWVKGRSHGARSETNGSCNIFKLLFLGWN